MKILILCTGNSCRSQMAEGFLKRFDANLEVFSAGTAPATEVHPMAITVMREIDINLNDNYPKLVDEFLTLEIDYVITVCGSAQETCPTFSGKVKNILHIGFDDPADAVGTPTEIHAEFCRVRDEIKRDFYDFYQKELN